MLQYNKMAYDGDPAVAFTNNHPYSSGDPIDCNAIYMGDNYEGVWSSACGAHEGNKYGDRYNGLAVFVKNKQCNGPYNHGYTGYREVCWFTEQSAANPTWLEADATCRAAGGRLAVPKNQDEMQWVYDRTDFRDGSISWLGVSDMNLDATWQSHYTGENLDWHNFVSTDNANGDEFYGAFK